MKRLLLPLIAAFFLLGLHPASAQITAAQLTAGSVTMSKINQAGASSDQVIAWNGSAWAPLSLSDTATSLQGTAVDTTAPLIGQALIYSSGTDKWSPETLNPQVVTMNVASSSYVLYSITGSIALAEDTSDTLSLPEPEFSGGYLYTVKIISANTSGHVGPLVISANVGTTAYIQGGYPGRALNLSSYSLYDVVGNSVSFISDGTNWHIVGSSPPSGEQDHFAGDGSTRIFTTTYPMVGLPQAVSIAGALQSPDGSGSTDAWSATATAVTFTTAPASGTLVLIGYSAPAGS